MIVKLTGALSLVWTRRAFPASEWGADEVLTNLAPRPLSWKQAGCGEEDEEGKGSRLGPQQIRLEEPHSELSECYWRPGDSGDLPGKTTSLFQASVSSSMKWGIMALIREAETLTRFHLAPAF